MASMNASSTTRTRPGARSDSRVDRGWRTPVGLVGLPTKTRSASAGTRSGCRTKPSARAQHVLVGHAAGPAQGRLRLGELRVHDEGSPTRDGARDQREGLGAPARGEDHLLGDAVASGQCRSGLVDDRVCREVADAVPQRRSRARPGVRALGRSRRSRPAPGPTSASPWWSKSDRGCRLGRRDGSATARSSRRVSCWTCAEEPAAVRHTRARRRRRRPGRTGSRPSGCADRRRATVARPVPAGSSVKPSTPSSCAHAAVGPAPGGAGPVEFVTARRRSGRPEDAVDGRASRAVLQGQARVHRCLRGNCPDEVVPVEGLAEIEQAGALGDGRHAGGDRVPDRTSEGRVAGEGRSVGLREAAAEVEPAGPGRERGVERRVEEDRLAAVGPQELVGLGIAEGEGAAAGHGDDRAGGWHCRGWGPPPHGATAVTTGWRSGRERIRRGEGAGRGRSTRRSARPGGRAR
jgi:hypothetical protein